MKTKIKLVALVAALTAFNASADMVQITKGYFCNHLEDLKEAHNHELNLQFKELGDYVDSGRCHWVTDPIVVNRTAEEDPITAFKVIGDDKTTLYTVISFVKPWKK